jgi:hypothetical protein
MPQRLPFSEGASLQRSMGETTAPSASNADERARGRLETLFFPSSQRLGRVQQPAVRSMLDASMAQILAIAHPTMGRADVSVHTHADRRMQLV